MAKRQVPAAPLTSTKQAKSEGSETAVDLGKEEGTHRQTIEDLFGEAEEDNDWTSMDQFLARFTHQQRCLMYQVLTSSSTRVTNTKNGLASEAARINKQFSPSSQSSAVSASMESTKGEKLTSPRARMEQEFWFNAKKTPEQLFVLIKISKSFKFFEDAMVTIDCGDIVWSKGEIWKGEHQLCSMDDEMKMMVGSAEGFAGAGLTESVADFQIAANAQ